MSEEREILEGLLTHPGWTAFQTAVGDLWGPKAYANRLKGAVSHARTVGKDASQAIELVDAANDAVAEVMRWPGERVVRLKQQEQEPTVSLSRRGGL